MLPLDVLATKESMTRLRDSWDASTADAPEWLQKEHAFQRSWFDDPGHAQIEYATSLHLCHKTAVS